MRILVCGGRDYDDYAKVCEVLDGLCPAAGDFLAPADTAIIHGGATGADALADKWAIDNCIVPDVYEADWGKHGRAAGPLRNQRMIDEGKPDLVVAFPGGLGTADMVHRARKAGVTVMEVKQGND